MTTKVVTDTVSHKTSQKGDSVVCAKGKLILIKPNYLSSRGIMQNQPIIISETEKISDDEKINGGIFYDSHYKNIRNDYVGLSNHKILALPENFSEKQNQAIADGKLKDGDEVLIECEIAAYDSKRRKLSYAIGDGDFTETTIKLNKDGHIIIHKKPQFTEAEQEAIRRFQNGEKYSTSTFIDEDTIVAGYGQLDDKSNPYDFKFPLPSVYIKHIFGTTSWETFRKKENEKIKSELRQAYWHGDMMRMENKTSQEEFDQWFDNKYKNA